MYDYKYKQVGSFRITYILRWAAVQAFGYFQCSLHSVIYCCHLLVVCCVWSGRELAHAHIQVIFGVPELMLLAIVWGLSVISLQFLFSPPFLCPIGALLLFPKPSPWWDAVYALFLISTLVQSIIKGCKIKNRIRIQEWAGRERKQREIKVLIINSGFVTMISSIGCSRVF